MTGAQHAGEVRGRLRALLCDLMLIPGLSGHEGRVRRHAAAEREAQHAGVEIHHHITRETPPSTMQAGRIDLDTCVHAVEGEAMYLLCGSADFVRDMWRGLVDRGVATSAINTETFFE